MTNHNDFLDITTEHPAADPQADRITYNALISSCEKYHGIHMDALGSLISVDGRHPANRLGLVDRIVYPTI